MSAGIPDLLKWSVGNSAAVGENAPLQLDESKANALAALLGFNVGSDAEKMAESLLVAKNEDGKYTMDQRVQAFEDFQMLVENLDNANNLHNIEQYPKGPRGLWTPLLDLLDNEAAEIRSWSALCLHSTVQNNEKTQEKLLLVGGIPKLVQLATSDSSKDVRKRAISAISSALKNYPPALDTIVSSMPEPYKPTSEIDATDMDSVDAWTSKLKAELL